MFARWNRLLAALGGVLAMLAMTLLNPSPTSAHSPSHRNCERVTQRVTLTPESTTPYTVVGWLCGDHRAASVQILNSGFTYGSYYWDFPYHGRQYSYVRAATDAGFAVLNIDRIGLGQSDKPPAAMVTIPAHAWVNAQLAVSLRKGKIGRHHPHFKYVVGVGHSLGAGVVTVAQTEYRSFDAIVPNGILHTTDPAIVAALGAIRYDAALDPKFAKANLPDGYLTTRPGTRHNYYTSKYVDGKVIGLDEQLKQTATTGETATLALARNVGISQRVTVPVLLWVGSADSLHCNEALAGLSCATTNAILEREATPWNATSCLGVYLQPRAGHDTTLHRTAPLGATAVSKWLNDQGFGPKRPSHFPKLKHYVRCA